MRLPLCLIIIFFTSLHSLNLNAQKDFRKGYIIKNEGDTITGYINYKSNQSNARKCFFKPDLQAEEQVLTPNDIVGFRFIDSKYYVSKQVGDSIKSEKLFLEFLINGTVDIYYCSELPNVHYFIENEKGEMLPLKSEKIEVHNEDGAFIKQKKEYVGVLKYIMADAPSLQGNINNVSLTHESLIEISQEYHHAVCTNSDCIVYEKKKATTSKTHWGILVGMNLSFLNSNGNFVGDEYYMIHNRFRSPLYPTVGLFIKTPISLAYENAYFQYDISFGKRTLETDFEKIDETYDDTPPVYYNRQQLTQSGINQSFMIKSESLNGIIRPLFQFGAFVNTYFNSSYKRELYLGYPDGEYKATYTNNPFSNCTFGLSLGSGFNTKLFDHPLILDIKYQIGLGMHTQYISQNVLFNLAVPFQR